MVLLRYENKKYRVTLALIFFLLLVPFGVSGQVQEAGDSPNNKSVLIKKSLLRAKSQTHPVDLDTLIKIGKFQAKANDREGAISTFEHVLEQIQTLPRLEANSHREGLYLQRARYVYFLMLAEALWEIDYKEFAAEIVQLARKSIETIQRPYDRIQALNRLFLTQIQLKLSAHPMALLALAPNKDPISGDLTYQKVEVLLSTANAQHAVGNDQATTRLLEEAHRKIAAIESVSSRYWLLAELASTFIKTGHGSKGMEIFRQAFHRFDSNTPDSEGSFAKEKIKFLVELATALHDVGDSLSAQTKISEALEIANAFFEEDRSAHSNALRTIALAKVNTGDIDGALAIEEEILDEHYKGQSFAPMAEEMIKRGELLQALALATRIGKRDEPRIGHILSQIGVAYAQSGKIQEALALTAQVGFPFQASIYFAVASQMTKEKPFDEVTTWVNKIEYPYYQIYALIGMTEGLLNKIQKRPRASTIAPRIPMIPRRID